MFVNVAVRELPKLALGMLHKAFTVICKKNHENGEAKCSSTFCLSTSPTLRLHFQLLAGRKPSSNSKDNLSKLLCYLEPYATSSCVALQVVFPQQNHHFGKGTVALTWSPMVPRLQNMCRKRRMSGIGCGEYKKYKMDLQVFPNLLNM